MPGAALDATLDGDVAPEEGLGGPTELDVEDARTDVPVGDVDPAVVNEDGCKIELDTELEPGNAEVDDCG